MPERLQRLDSIFQRLPIYFVTACTHERRSILNNADINKCLAEFGERGCHRGAWLGAYVLMPDHFHVFAVVDDERLDLSTWVKSLNWQKGFFDHILRSDDSYSQKWNYVRHNPVRAGLVKKWEEWPFAGEIFDLDFTDDHV